MSRTTYGQAATAKTAKARMAAIEDTIGPATRTYTWSGLDVEPIEASTSRPLYKFGALSTRRNSVVQHNASLATIAEQTPTCQRAAITTSLAQAAAERSAMAGQMQPVADKRKLDTAERVPLIMRALLSGELEFDNWLQHESGGKIDGQLVDLLSALHYCRKSWTRHYYQQWHALQARRLETQDAYEYEKIANE